MAVDFTDFTTGGTFSPDNYLVGYDVDASGGEKKWKYSTLLRSLSSDLSSVIISDNPPAGASNGDLWFDSSSGITSIYYDSTWVDVGGGDSSTSLNVVNSPTVDLSYNSSTGALSGSVVDASITNVKLAFDGGSFAFRNKIINGGFDIWQRGTTFTGIGAEVFTADRWTTSTSTATLNKNISRQTLLATDLPATEAGLIYYLRGSYTSGTNASEWYIGTPIELSTTGRSAPFKVGRQYTLSYYARTQGASYTIPVLLQYRNNSQTLATNTVASKSQVVTTSWARYTLTFTMVEPDSSSNACLVVYFGAIGTLPPNTNIDITGVQLEEGPTATPFEHRPIGTELALCQRYYQYIDLSNQAWAISNRAETTKNPACVTITFPVQLRSTPLFEYWSTTYGKNKISLRGADGTELASMTASHLSVTKDAAMIRSNITTYYGFVVSWVIADAEL